MTQPSGSFRIDMEQAPSAVQELKSALAELEDIRRDATKLGTVHSGSRDSVSVDAARLLGAAAVGGPGALVTALDAGIQQMKDLVATMEAELNAYRGVDREAASRLQASDISERSP